MIRPPFTVVSYQGLTCAFAIPADVVPVPTFSFEVDGQTYTVTIGDRRQGAIVDRLPPGAIWGPGTNLMTPMYEGERVAVNVPGSVIDAFYLEGASSASFEEDGRRYTLHAIWPGRTRDFEMRDDG